MIRRLLLVIIVFFLFPAVICSAEESSEDPLSGYRKEIDSSLSSSVDEQTMQTLEENGITPASSDDVGITKILVNIADRFKASLFEPLKILGKLIAVCAFTVMIKSFTEGTSYEELYDTISVLANICIIYSSSQLAINSVRTGLEDISAFMLTYIPVFSGVVASGSAVASASGYYTVMFVLCELITYISANLLLPFTGVVFALNIVGSINGSIDLQGLSSSIKNLTKWILTALMTVFTAVLSLKGIANAQIDSVASKTMRFAASSFIPIVGGSVSEAYSAIYGSLGMIKSGVGIFGIGAVAVITLRPVIAAAAYKLIISIGAVIADLFGQRRVAGLLRGLGGVLDIALGIIIVMAMIFIISTAVIMLTTMNTV